MPVNFKPLSSEVYNVGKHFKSSKKRFMWKFELNEEPHVIDLYVSRFSGKRKVLLDGDIQLETKDSSLAVGTHYPVRVGYYTLHIYEPFHYMFDLRCGNLSFHNILNKQKYSQTEIAQWEEYSEEDYRDYKRDTRPKPKPTPKAPKSEPKEPEPPNEPAFDVFDQPVPLPQDVFAQSPNPFGLEPKYNPFEETVDSYPAQPHFVTSESAVLSPSQKPNTDPLCKIIDLENINKPSPTANQFKPVTVGENVPNVPLNQLMTQRPQTTNPMMMYYMTGINPWLQRYPQQ